MNEEISNIINQEENLEKKELFSTGYSGAKFTVDSPVFDVAEHFDDLLRWAFKEKVSDLNFKSNQPVYPDIAGNLEKVTDFKLEHYQVEQLVNYMYGANGTSRLSDSQDLDLSYEVKNSKSDYLRFRVNATACRVDNGNGIEVTMRLLSSTPPLMSDLNIEPIIVNNWKQDEGLILVCGATGSGKSTLLSAGTRMLIEDPDYSKKILEYSAPIEYVYDTCNFPKGFNPISQSEIPRHLPTFSAGVRNSLRRKPTAIIVGETRDRETIDATLEASLTGHIVYSTLHTNGVVETLRRILAFYSGTERESRSIDIMNSLRMIINQKLLPKKGGGLVGVREYFVFNKEDRLKFLETPSDQWTTLANKLLNDKEHERSKSFKKSCMELLDKGLITEETYHEKVVNM